MNYSLYLCTDEDLMTTATVEESVEKAILGGVTIVQLREKNSTSKEFYETAVRVKKITDKYNVPLIINDRVDIAMAVDAAGVHVGQKDLPASIIRKILGNHKIIGVSAATVEEAVKASEDGADYIGVGAVFTTSTKDNTRAVSKERLLEIRQAVSIPMVAIGGINENNISNLYGTKVNGVAVVSAIVAKEDITKAASNLAEMVKNL